MRFALQLAPGLRALNQLAMGFQGTQTGTSPSFVCVHHQEYVAFNWSTMAARTTVFSFAEEMVVEISTYRLVDS